LSEDGNISPRRRSPVWIVVSLLRALKSVSVSIVVLTSVDGSGSSESTNGSSVSSVQTSVSVSSVAGIIVDSVLVHSVHELTGSIDYGWSVSIVGDGVGSGSISNSDGWIVVLVGAHVLDHHVAPQLGRLTTTVLVGPLNGEQRTFIKGHGRSHAVTALGVVLGIKQTIGVVSVGVGFVESVVGATRVLHVQISKDRGKKSQKNQSDVVHLLGGFF